MSKQIKTFLEYQKKAHKTAVYPEDKALEYLTLGLVGEAGELANKVKKIVRQDTQNIPFEDLQDELGDVLWYMQELSSFIAPRIEDSLGYIAYRNIEKLKDRQKRGVIKGTGDKR